MKNKIAIGKPENPGETILGMSKIQIYKFFYDCIILKWGKEKLQFFYIDTDALVLEIKSLDYDRDI